MTAEATEYKIEVEPAGVRVRALVDGICVADSARALVMHETRLPSRVYFPKADLAADLLEESSFRTFCPFKGTGKHWHLHVGDRRFENSAWSYEKPLVEARDVDGYVALYPNVAEVVAEGGALPSTPEIGYTSGPLVEWLLREAWQCKTAAELTRQLAERLVDDGVPLSRLSVSVWTLHAEVFGKRYLWKPGVRAVDETDLPHAVLSQPSYLDSPFRYVRDGLGGIRQRLADGPLEFDFPVLRQLRDEGATDYVAMPLWFSDGQTHALALATNAPDGFSTKMLGRIFEASALLARLYEVLTLRRETPALLDTYLGTRTGSLVLDGNTRRGDGRDIRAVVLFCDLRDSTAMQERMARARYLDLLNVYRAYSEAVSSAVAAHGDLATRHADVRALRAAKPEILRLPLSDTPLAAAPPLTACVRAG